MTDAAVTTATFVEFRQIKGRKQYQIILEVPVESADAALRALGGLPRSDESRWVAVALLNPAIKTTGAAHAERPADDLPPSVRDSRAPCDDIARPDDGAGPGFSSLPGDQIGAGQMPPRPSKDEASAADRARPHKRWADMPVGQRAALMCQDERFWAIADNATSEEAAADWMRSQCGVSSRSKIASSGHSLLAFRRIETEYLAETGRIPRP